MRYQLSEIRKVEAIGLRLEKPNPIEHKTETQDLRSLNPLAFSVHLEITNTRPKKEKQPNIRRHNVKLCEICKTRKATVLKVVPQFRKLEPSDICDICSKNVEKAYSKNTIGKYDYWTGILGLRQLFQITETIRPRPQERPQETNLAKYLVRRP
jgi:hypothetical protein